MKYIRLISKAKIIYIIEIIRFDYKNNYKYFILANFLLDNISKISFKLLIITIYILLKLRLRNI